MIPYVYILRCIWIRHAWLMFLHMYIQLLIIVFQSSVYTSIKQTWKIGYVQGALVFCL